MLASDVLSVLSKAGIRKLVQGVWCLLSLKSVPGAKAGLHFVLSLDETA